MAALAAAGTAFWLAASGTRLSAAERTLREAVDGAAVTTALLDVLLGAEADPLETAGLDGLLRAAVEDVSALAAEGQAVSAQLTGAARSETSAGTGSSEGSAASDSSVLPEVTVIVTDAADASSGNLPPEEETEAGTEQEEPDDGIPAVSLDSAAIAAVDPADIAITNHTDALTVDAAAMLAADPAVSLSPASEGPQILILHTHATEAYRMDGEDIYEESDNSRTTDENYNMIRIGEEIKAVFEAHGLSVVHDKTTYDYPGYNGSYTRALEGIEAYLAEYPTISVVMDVHRDAMIGDDGTVYAKTTTIDGESVAQVMLVMGTDECGFEHSGWRDNMTLAVHLQAAMLAIDPTLPRAIDLRQQRFNQHATSGSILVEVGTSGNTLQEAIRGGRLFAEAASAVLLGELEE